MKVILPLRVFLIVSALWLTAFPTYAFFQNATSKAKIKTKYEFTDTRISEADTLLKQREYQPALEAYQKAYDTYEAEEFYEGMVYAKERMGRTYRSLGEDGLSRVTYEDAAQLSRERLGPNHILESRAYLNNGIRAHFKNDFVSASKYFDTTMLVYNNSLLYDSVTLKSIIDFKFYSYFYSDVNRDTLIKYLNLRAEYNEKQGSNMNEDVYLLSDYSRAFYRRGEFFKSVAYGLEATRLANEELSSIDAFFYSDALFNLTRSLNKQKDYEKALSIGNQLIEFTLSNDPESRSLMGYYNVKAVTLNGLERYEEAANEFRKIIKHLEKKKDFSTFYRSTIMNLGVCYELMGNYELAEIFLFKALNNEKKDLAGIARILSTRYKYLGQYFLAIGNHDKSLAYYDSALRSYVRGYEGSFLEYPYETEIDPTFEVLSLLRNKVHGLLLAEQDRTYTKAAIEHVKNTHNFLVDNREELQASTERLFLSEGFKTLYEDGVEACFRLFENSENDESEEYFIKAFEFFNFSKSILFLEQSGELNDIQEGNVSSEFKDRYYKIVKKQDSLEASFRKLTKGRVFGDSIRSVNSQLLILNKDLSELRKQIYLSHKKKNLESNTYDEILKVLVESPNKAYLEYFVGEEHIYMLGLTSEKKIFKKLLNTNNFAPQLRAFFKQLSTRPEISNYENQLSKYKKHANNLYSIILEPAISEFGEAIEEITIVPDESLSMLPFETLIIDTSYSATSYKGLNYLMKKYNINYALSSSRVQSEKSVKRGHKGLLGIGFSGDGSSSLRSSFGSLPGTEDEINYLKKNISGDYYLGSDGSKENFLKSAQDYDVLHLAVHGRADSSDRYESSLIFNGKNGELKTNDLYVANIKARLAILSACESGIGELNKGEGTFSIARGFALVGVPSIVMSLWKVNDKVASELMVEMHKHLSSGDKVNLALVKTKRNYLINSDKYTSHPYYWSAFISVGEEVNVSKDESPKILKWMQMIVVVFVLLSIVFLLIKKRKGVN